MRFAPPALLRCRGRSASVASALHSQAAARVRRARGTIRGRARIDWPGALRAAVVRRRAGMGDHESGEVSQFVTTARLLLHYGIEMKRTTEELMHLVHSGERSTEDIPPIVLLVDDDEDTLEMYDDCLSAKGYWVARAANGLEALECALDLRPDAVVTDIGLGGDMDGTDLLRELRADAAMREVPVLVVTGRGPRELPSLAGIETAGLLLKPVAPETLAARLASVLRTSASLRGRRPVGAYPVIPPQPESQPAIVAKAPAGNGDKKRRTCPKCGTGLTWVETRRCDGVVCDYYRACSHGCGMFFFNRALREWETLLGHESPS